MCGDLLSSLNSTLCCQFAILFQMVQGIYNDHIYIHVQDKSTRSDCVRALLTSYTCSYKTAYRLVYSKWNAHITNVIYPFPEGMVSLSLNGEAANADPLCA